MFIVINTPCFFIFCKIGFTSVYKNPVEIAVNYPFLFCIVDKELDVALIAGRILNPLNSRIQ